MAKTFMEMVKEARQFVTKIDAVDLKAEMALKENSPLVIDVRDAADIAMNGIVPNATAISLGSLYYKADMTLPERMRHPELSDFDRPIVLTCFFGAMSSIGAKVLHDMGYTNVRYLTDGTNGWLDAGYEVEEFTRDHYIK